MRADGNVLDLSKKNGGKTSSSNFIHIFFLKRFCEFDMVDNEGSLISSKHGGDLWYLKSIFDFFSFVIWKWVIFFLEDIFIAAVHI